jgi:hypothetical protein
MKKPVKKRSAVIVLKDTKVYKILAAIYTFLIEVKVITVPKWFFPASCIGSFIIIRERDYNQAVLNHEYIHYMQQREMFFIGAYILYILEFTCKFFYYFKIKDIPRGIKNAYINVSFEREAHSMQPMIGYCGHRKKYSHFQCIYMKNYTGLKFRKK